MNFIKTYFKMKMNEWKVKAQIYGMIVEFMDNQKDILEFMKKLYIELDVNSEDFQKEAVSKIIEFVNREQ